MNRALLTLLLAIATCLPLPAQEAGEPRKLTGRLAWFVVTGMPDDVENPVKVMTGKDITEVTLSKRMASGPVKFPEDGIVRIVREVPNPEDAETPAYRTLAQARIPDGTSKALIILVPAANPESGLIFQSKVQNLAAFRGGDYLYLNLTKVNVAVQLGDQRIGLKPGDLEIYDTPDLRKSLNAPVAYHYYHPTRKEWKLLSASTIVLRPTRREICIFSWDPRFDRVDYHGITFPVEE